MTRWMFLATMLMGTLLQGEEPSLDVPEELGVKEYLVPFKEDKLYTRDVMQRALEVSGSEVKLPKNFPDAGIPVHPVAVGVLVKSWNLFAEDKGVSFIQKEEGILLRVDRVKVEGKLDEFEDAFITFFKIDRPYTLHHISDKNSKGPVVVVVHGLDSGIRFFQTTLKELDKRGYDVYFFEYPNDDRIERNAERLSSVLKQLPKDRRQDISLVTVSMGGVISRWMIETPELYPDGVKRLIACVPPFQGSELAAMRFIIEIGDQTMKALDPRKAADLFGDGMGRAGTDLQPDSVLMQKMERKERNPKVDYAILAGNKGMVDVAVLERVRKELKEADPRNGVSEAMRRLSLERLEILLSFHDGHGDGAVLLDSATLEGVTDRVVLPHHHLEFLTDLTRENPPPAFEEVLKRLPEP